MTAMVQKRFGIYGDEEVLDPQLAVEIGRNHLALVSGNRGKVDGIEVFDTGGADLEDALQFIKSSGELMKRQYSETRIYFNLPESVLVPVGQFNSGLASEFLDLAFGERGGCRVNVESVNVSPGIVNVYRVQENWQDTLGRYFRVVTRRHIYSRLAEYTVLEGDSLFLQFYDKEFLVMASRQGKLLLSRTFEFTADADLLYHLLNICKQLGFEPASGKLILSGFLQRDAGAASLVAGYFENLEWDGPGDTSLPEGVNQHPSHYFSSFIKLLS